MSVIVPRTCTVIADGDAEPSRSGNSRPLEEFRSAPAYVLLGDPGFRQEHRFRDGVRRSPGRCQPCLRAQFRARRLDCHPEWRAKTLFIDGLDEIRAGSPDARAPLDEICERLDALGRPRFRLSCREADWLGANDWKHLKDVSPNSKVVILRLDPLTDADVVRILNGRPDIDDAEDFIASARKKGVDSLLTNPLTLDLLARVVARGGRWPEGRRETFEAACLADGSRAQRRAQTCGTLRPFRARLPDAENSWRLPDAFARFSSSRASRVTHCATTRRVDDHPAVEQCEYKRPEQLRAALSTKLFKAVRGRGRSVRPGSPAHRRVSGREAPGTARRGRAPGLARSRAHHGR